MTDAAMYPGRDTCGRYSVEDKMQVVTSLGTIHGSTVRWRRRAKPKKSPVVAPSYLSSACLVNRHDLCHETDCYCMCHENVRTQSYMCVIPENLSQAGCAHGAARAMMYA